MFRLFVGFRRKKETDTANKFPVLYINLTGGDPLTEQYQDRKNNVYRILHRVRDIKNGREETEQRIAEELVRILIRQKKDGGDSDGHCRIRKEIGGEGKLHQL